MHISGDPHALDLPALDPSDRVHGVLGAALAAAGQVTAPKAPRADQWDPSFFGLHRAQAFRGATPAQQRTILEAAGRSMLEEAYYVEQCGMVYAGKMILLASTLEERALYSLFAADEARHLHGIGGWLAGDELGAPSPFHHLLADVFDRADPVGAVLIVQVLLEGWGLRHYADLARSCRDPDLSAMLSGIVRDETRHHGSGVMIAGRTGLSDEGHVAALELMGSFLDMVRVGPLGVLAAVERGVGSLSRDDRLTTLHELRAEEHAAQRLKILHGLLGIRTAEPVRAELEAQGRFQPIPSEAVA